MPAILNPLLFAFVPGSFLLFSFFISENFIKTGLPQSGILTSTHRQSEDDKCSNLEEGILEESPSMKLSKQKCWWLDSGAIFITKNNIGKTIQGQLAETSYWKKEYLETSPEDTNKGLRPQNIFRLINKNNWKNVSQTIFFKVNAYDLSPSPNRNQSNGVLLMSRYIDNNNLYYAGMRVDGTAVIKKKFNGEYITLATSKYNTASNEEYDLFKNPIILSKNKWLGEKFITKNNLDGSVNLRLFVKLGDSDPWVKLIEVNDSQKFSGSVPFITEGNVGIRSDFMDIEISNFSIDPA